jgi:hypothetical protein
MSKVHYCNKSLLVPPFESGIGGVIAAVLEKEQDKYIKEVVLQVDEILIASDWLGNFGNMKDVKIHNLDIASDYS